MEKYYFKSKPNEYIVVRWGVAREGEELVKKTIEAKTPQEVAELFYGRRYLNGKMFYQALDLSEKTANTKCGLETQDAIYFLNNFEHHFNEGFLPEKEADEFAHEVIDGVCGD